jgi:predicted RNA-binding Zn-ribbon protein involved in translation (DUF1610 family)
MTLIPIKDLQSARAKFAKEHTGNVATAKAGFVYKPRTEQQLFSRVHQKALPPLPPSALGERSLTTTTPILVGITPVAMTPTATAATAEAAHKFVETRRAYIACANCGHWRCQHCTKRKHLKAGEVPSHAKWKGFSDDEGQIQPCSHTLSDAQPYVCTSAACAVVIGDSDDAHYCPCPRFLIKKPTKAPATPRATRAELAHKAKVLIEVVTENPRLSIAELADASERPPAWVRSTLKKSGIVLGKPRTAVNP